MYLDIVNFSPSLSSELAYSLHQNSTLNSLVVYYFSTYTFLPEMSLHNSLTNSIIMDTYSTINPTVISHLKYHLQLKYSTNLTDYFFPAIKLDFLKFLTYSLTKILMLLPSFNCSLFCDQKKGIQIYIPWYKQSS